MAGEDVKLLQEKITGINDIIIIIMTIVKNLYRTAKV